MSTLDTNTWYRIFYTVYQTFTLVAADINASGTAAVVVLPMGSYSGYDDWQPVLIPGTSGNGAQYGFRSRALNNHSLLAIFSASPGDTRGRVDIESSTDDFPLQTRWILAPYGQQKDTYYMLNAANSTSTYFTSAWQTDTQADVFMQNVGTNLTAAGTWTFVSHASVNASSSASSTYSPSVTTAATATLSPTSSSTSSSSSQIPSNTSNERSLSSGAKAGIAAGCVSAVLLLAILGLLAIRRRRKRSVPTVSAQEADSLSVQMRCNEMPANGHVSQKAELVGEPSPVHKKQRYQQSFPHEMDATNSQPQSTWR